jgi:L-rhamnose mutarotase
MRRWAQTVLLRDDEVIAEYERLHRNPWPEITQSMEASGIRRAFIYRIGRLLFFFGETDDSAEKFELPPAVLARCNEWGVLMTSWQTPIEGYTPSNPANKWAPMEEIYTFEILSQV